jgi:AcrR family transcriptional regulator
VAKTDEVVPGPGGTGGVRSARTRAAILAAARAQFGTVGYERATIRAIAAQAGIDPAMVMRYYGNKAGLFAAASTIDLHLPDLTGVARRRMGEVLARHFLDLWEGDLAEDALVFMLRSAVTEEAAAGRMRAIFAEQVARPIAEALGDDPEATRRAAMVGSQLLGVALCRYILRLEPIASTNPEAVAADLAPTLQRYLTGSLHHEAQSARRTSGP